MRDLIRKYMDIWMHGVLLGASFVALVPLFGVFSYVLKKGWPALSKGFFVNLPTPVGEVGGGFGNAILGSVVLILLASIVGVPWGVLCGIYLAEYRRSKLAQWLRFTVDVLTSVPSIIVGLFIYAIVVKPMANFSALAGAASLALIMIPVVARTTEEMLKLVPRATREAGLALGLPRWKVILFITLRGAVSGVATGVLLAIARVAGETAPLLFTAFNNRYWSHTLFEPVASLPVQIYVYAISPFEEWHQQAWAGALVLLFFILFVNLFIRFLIFSRGAGRTS